MSDGFATHSVIVTGAAKGIGREVALSFAARGANVLMCDIDAAALKPVAALPTPPVSGRLVPHVMDVASETEWEAAIRRAVDEFGRLDHLVNVAGVTHIATIVETGSKEWQQVMNVNLLGTFLGIKAALIVMLEQRGGTITTIGSIAAKRPIASLSAYSASKAAVISLTQTAALEAAPTVRVNCVCPGVLDTDMQELEYEVMSRTTGKGRDQIRQEWIDAIPLHALQETRNIADAVLFLASDAASQITGESLNVNGGWLMD